MFVVVLVSGLSEFIKKKSIKVSSLRSRIAHLGSLTLTDVVLEEMVNAKLQMNMEVDREEIYWEQRAREN